MSPITEYQRATQENSELYGPKTVVLMQIGSFYEIYQYVPTEASDSQLQIPGWGHAVELSTLLNMVLTRKNKSLPHSITNPYLVGFPCISYEKHRDVILNANYTIIRIDQTESGKTHVDRKVAEITSSATEPDLGTNRLVTIFLEKIRTGNTLDQLLLQAGVASIEVATGNSIVAEFYSSPIYPLSALQEIYRFLVAMQPREVIIYHTEISASLKSEIGTQLDLQRYPMVNWRSNFPVEYQKLPFQIEILKKFFPLETIESLNLERLEVGRLTYLLLLQYCYEHNPILLRRLHHPETTWADSAQHLTLTHNAILQLDLISGNPKSRTSVLSIIDNTVTALGSRRLKDLLLNPITSIEQLNIMYQSIAYLLDDSDLLDQFRISLRKITDLERAHRRIMMETISPSEVSMTIRSYLVVIELMTELVKRENHQILLTNGLRQSEAEIFNVTLRWILSRYSLENLEALKITKTGIEYPIEKSWILQGVNHKYDGLRIRWQELNQQVEEIQAKLNQSAPGRGSIEYDPSEKAYGFLTSATKAKQLKASELSSELEIREYKSKVLVTSARILELLTTREAVETQIKETMVTEFENLRQFLISTTSPIFETLTRFIGHLDILQSHAITARKYGYYQPELVNSETSFFSVTGIRHPLVERIIDVPYIINDISLGQDHLGVLLYGLNSAGKSTLVKAIGVIVIMAQIGMYVPGHLTLSPFSQIITRLSGHDDLINGQSSFVVEMSELRTILRQANSRSLVLGDELCRGTESTSGSSLTIATLEHLISIKCCHIFSSHLHQLPDNKYLKPLIPEKLRIYHLSTLYDSITDTLKYNRKLTEGPGDSLYGLEVAKSLHLDPEFISRTIQIRREILQEPDLIVNPKTSRYSSKVYMDSCVLCGKRQQLETHHRREQQTAIEGLITVESEAPFPKDAKFNLVVVCESCHQKIHQ